MSRQRHNVFNPITIDVDGPFGLAVCQPSTVPRPFVGVKGSVDPFEAQRSELYQPSIEKSIGNLTALGELEEIYAECGNPTGSTITNTESNYGGRKMSTMPRPFASVHCHNHHSTQRSFSVDMNHSYGKTGVRKSVIYHPDYSCSAHSAVSYSPSTPSTNNKKKKRMRACCCIVGSHLATIIFTLLIVAVSLLVVQLKSRPGVSEEKSLNEMSINNGSDSSASKIFEHQERENKSSSHKVRIMKEESQVYQNQSHQINEDTNIDVIRFETSTTMQKNEFSGKNTLDARLVEQKNYNLITETKNKISETTASIITKKDITANHQDVTILMNENNTHSCCQMLNLSSTGETKRLYPYVIGLYRLVDTARNVYQKKGQKRFISRPQGLTRRGVNTFSWGINSNPDGKWGWIKAFKNADCPDLIDHWKAYDTTKKTWVADRTIAFQCI